MILKLKFLLKTNFSEHQEIVAFTFSFIKANYAFADQNFKPSLLINKVIVKKRDETVSFRFLTRNYKTEKTWNCGQGVADKAHKIKENRFFRGMFFS